MNQEALNSGLEIKEDTFEQSLVLQPLALLLSKNIDGTKTSWKYYAGLEY